MSTILESPPPDIFTGRIGRSYGANERAAIEVRRAAKWFGVLRAFEVSIDDCWVGRAGWNVPGRFPVSPGRHTVAAKMDWVKTKAVPIDLDPGECLVFVCDMESSCRRAWNVALLMLGVLITLSGISLCVTWAFPWLKSHTASLVGVCGLPCLAAMGVCEIIVFSRMMPWSAPGRALRLVQQA